MKMAFTYEDFLEHYLHSAALMPPGPLYPLCVADATKLNEAIDENGVNARIRRTFNELEKRMGGEYFAAFERVQTCAKDYGAMVFPAYKMLFLDIACEDWLSLLDFHKDFSRDHSVHQPLTAYIVCKLLGGGDAKQAFQIAGESLLDKALDVILNKPESKYLFDRIAQKDPASPLLKAGKELWKPIFYQTAIITAMYHDLGYPWQFVERIHGFLQDEKLLFGRLPEDSSLVENYVAAHKGELMFRPFYNYGKGGQTSDQINVALFSEYIHKSHGVIGALAYQEYNKKFRSNEHTPMSAMIEFCQEWSSLAILMHDMQKAYETSKSGFPRLDFNTDPLSYIISLADTLEDFNRPNAVFTTNPKGCGIVYSFPSLSVELEEEGGEAEIRYNVSAETKDDQTERKVKDQKELFDQPKGYFDLPSIGIKTLKISCL